MQQGAAAEALPAWARRSRRSTSYVSLPFTRASVVFSQQQDIFDSYSSCICLLCSCYHTRCFSSCICAAGYSPVHKLLYLSCICLICLLFFFFFFSRPFLHDSFQFWPKLPPAPSQLSPSLSWFVNPTCTAYSRGQVKSRKMAGTRSSTDHKGKLVSTSFHFDNYPFQAVCTHLASFSLVFL